MPISVTDLEYFNGNWYFAIYDDSHPHVYKTTPDLAQTIDLGVIDPEAWNYWQFIKYNNQLFVFNALRSGADLATLIRVDDAANSYVSTGYPNFTWSAFKYDSFKFITELSNELWCLHEEDTKVFVFNGTSWRTEGELCYNGSTESNHALFWKNGTDIYLKGSDFDREIDGFFKYNPSHVFNGEWGDTIGWEFVKNYDPGNLIIGYVISTFNYDNKLFISGTTKLAEFDFINLEYKNIQNIPNAKFLMFNNLLHCRSSDRKLYKYENDTWTETQFALLPLSTESDIILGSRKVVNVDNKLYVTNNTACLTLNCIE